MSDRPRKNSNNRDRNGETVKNKQAFKNGSAATHRTPTQAFKPGRTEERPPKRPFSASPSCGQQAPRGVAADEARNLWSPMAGVNTPLFRGQIRPLRGVFPGRSHFGSRSCRICPQQKAPGGSRGTPGQNPIPCAMHNPGSPKNPVSPDFRPGLVGKRMLGPEGRVSTSRRRSAKRKRHDVVFRVKQPPRTSVRGFLSNVAVPFHPIQTNASAVSAGAGPYFKGAIVKLARPWLTLRTAAE